MKSHTSKRNHSIFSVAMSQEEIFRKYMSESAQARKKARNARHSAGGNIAIIDNEVSMNQIQAGHRAEDEYGEDAPQECYWTATLLTTSVL